jgi:thymidylate kinase
LNLEKVFEKQMQRMNQQGEELSKKQSKINQLNVDLKTQQDQTSEKEKTILKFAQDVHKIVQTKDEKAYVTGVMKLNQDYVMSQAAYQDLGKKKDPEALEELDRQLRYMERSIATLKVNTIKNETRTKNDIKRRTKENTQLIVELNSIKFEEKKLKTEIMIKNKEIENLEADLKKHAEEHHLSQLSTTKKARKDNDDLSENGEGGDHMPSLLKGGNASGNMSKIGIGGGLSKGVTPFMKKKENVEDKIRIQELNVSIIDRICVFNFLIIVTNG